MIREPGRGVGSIWTVRVYIYISELARLVWTACSLSCLVSDGLARLSSYSRRCVPRGYVVVVVWVCKTRAGRQVERGGWNGSAWMGGGGWGAGETTAGATRWDGADSATEVEKYDLASARVAAHGSRLTARVSERLVCRSGHGIRDTSESRSEQLTLLSLCVCVSCVVCRGPALGLAFFFLRRCVWVCECEGGWEIWSELRSDLLLLLLD
jgi:hypothetical protein